MMSPLGRLCCKTPKMAWSDFSAKRATKRQSPIDVSSSALPKLPVSSSPVPAVPPTRLFARRAYSPENLSSVIQKEFCNKICTFRTYATKPTMSVHRRKADLAVGRAGS